MIGKGELITALDVETKNKNQPWVNKTYVQAIDVRAVLTTKTSTNYVWIRSSPERLSYIEWDNGHTYDEGYRCWYNGAIWKSLGDSNIGNTPQEGALWTSIESTTTESYVWNNLYLVGDMAEGGNGDGESLGGSLKAYLVTWDSGENPTYTLKETLNVTYGGATTAVGQVEPGYYKLVTTASAKAPSHEVEGQWYIGWARSNIRGYTKSADTIINKDSFIALWNSSYSELTGESTSINFKDAQDYKFGSLDYEGGLYLDITE